VFLDEAVRFAFDAFAFGQDRTPHLKATAQVRLFDHLVLLAGVDDIADGAHRDYFLGLGLTFTDDDLKALLTVAPTPPM
jgi:phospholipid/cholesterol/gamma-HCH transport system substrate-binding protein